MLEFIGRTQVEMAEAGEGDGAAEGEVGRVVRGMMEGLGGLIGMVQGEVKDEKERERGKAEFKELNLLEMMDVLTGELVKWQKAFT